MVTWRSGFYVLLPLVLSLGLAGTRQLAVDPGVRSGGGPAVGGPVNGVDAQYFSNVCLAFQEVHSIAGDLEPGAGLGPRFNGTSCGGCHAFPETGGSSPKQNPQIAMATAHDAVNVIPSFLKKDGPILAVRVKTRQGAARPNDVLPLFTVKGRSDAYHCAMEQPDFTDLSTLSFRIPTPVFGAGMIDNLPDAVILAGVQSNAARKAELGIAGRANLGSDGRVGKFGWKAQHPSLSSFAEEAYQVEMGVLNGGSVYRREPLSKGCYAIYDAAYEDQYASSSYDSGGPSAFLFTEFMRFLDAPKPVTTLPQATEESIAHGRRIFADVGCALCHTPSLRSGRESMLAALNNRDVSLYSDLLLHHMGSRLADGIMQGMAGPDEFRTAPLWGLGQRIYLLHDGRTTDLMVAIEDHAGGEGKSPSEATAVVDRFVRLPASEQQDLLNFLRSL